MKNLVIIIIIMVLSFNALAINDTIRVQSEVRKVTVFLRGGEEIRKANVELPKGTSCLVFTKLSPYIDVKSLQLKSNQEITILSVTHQFNYLDEMGRSEKSKQLEKEKASLEESMQMEQSMIGVYRQEEELILSNKKLSSEQLGVNIEELKKAAELYRTRLAEIKSKQLEINKKIVAYNSRLAKIQQQLTEINSKQATKTSEVTVTLAAITTMNTELTLHYFVDGCGWVPKYNIRATNVNSPMELNYKADVYQNTGCNWENVDLVLSTGEPLKNGTKPELDKWVINESNRYSGNNLKQDKSFTNTAFELKTKYSIPSNGKNYTADLIDYNIPATYKYSCVPKVEEAAFLMAYIANWEQYKLLSGEVNLFFEGTFVGKSMLDVSKTEDTLVFSLGRDKNVIVKREKQDEYNKTQFIGNKKTEMFTWEISLRNNKKQEIELIVEDQVPVSNSREIDVKHNDLGEAELDKESGLIKWTMKLQPSENKKLKFSYEVRYPDDISLTL
ncbi:MAG: mucoidy inhibitor MuiA family protein [Bacteroidales bacterium]